MLKESILTLELRKLEELLAEMEFYLEIYKYSREKYIDKYLKV